MKKQDEKDKTKVKVDFWLFFLSRPSAFLWGLGAQRVFKAAC